MGERIKLTEHSKKGGCAAKWAPGDLETILAGIMESTDPDLLAGFETSDDAAIYRLSEHQAAVLTVDFLTPLVDDPYDYGRVAATNAISDVYAMGGKPLCALNTLALDCKLGTEVAAEILRGGADAAHAAGIPIVGGHSIDDAEPKYGLCVLGLVDPDKVVRNKGAQVGDKIYLTKPIGTGLLSAGFKIREIGIEEFQCAIDSMCELNRAASEAMLEAGVHAATDVTGFSLAGHLHEMCEASGIGARIDFDAIPQFPGAWELAEAYCRPNRTFSIMDFAAPFLRDECVDLSEDELDNRLAIVCDPQTSGGLLCAIPPESAKAFEASFEARAGRKPTCIGEFCEGEFITLV